MTKAIMLAGVIVTLLSVASLYAQSSCKVSLPAITDNYVGD